MDRRPANLLMLVAALGSGAAALTVTSPAISQVPPPLPGRGEAERTSPSVRGLTTEPTGNPHALSGPDAPVRLAPGSRVAPDHRPEPKTPGRPTTAGPDPLVVLNQPQPLVPVDASVEDRNALDTSLRVLSPETWLPTGFRTAYEHPDDPSYSVRLDGALMLVYEDGLYVRRGGRTLVGMPPGAWYVIGREDLRPRIRKIETDGPERNEHSLAAAVAPVPSSVAARTDGIRLDLRVIPVRPEADPVAAPEPTPAPVDPPIEVNSAPPASGLRILRDESYRRRFLQQLRERFDSEEKPVTGPAGS